jgi:DMSO reductase anchor subunit
MRPTFSIIFFTVLSGAGYGLFFLLGLGLACGVSLTPYQSVGIDDFHFGRLAIVPVIHDPRIRLAVFLAIGVLLTTVGLLASVAHLGKPLRAWRAFSQWRSSWLSREGVASLVTYLPIAVIAFVLFARPDAHMDLRLLGLLLVLCCIATVFCTAHIYSSLPPIRAWHNRYTLPVYLLLGLYSGSLWLIALDWLPIRGALYEDAVKVVWLVSAIITAPACGWLKWRYWRYLDTDAHAPHAGAATGLDRLGTVRSFEQPHTEENYLTHEMGFVLARKHSAKLRAIAFWTILLTPIATLPLTWLIGWAATWLTLIVGMLGIFVERWLFFAEAKHAVMAYYGR